MESIFYYFSLPKKCYLNKKIFKKLILEQIKLGATDKKVIIDDIKELRVGYSLNPDNIAISAYSDDEREYLEIQFITVRLRAPKRAERIAEILHRSIPYPLVLLLECEGLTMLHLAEKRLSLADSGKMTVEHKVYTGWLGLSNLRKVESDFFQSLEGLPYTNFLAYYRAIAERIIALNCAELSGCFELGKKNRQEALETIRKLRQQQDEIRGKLKKEKNMGTKVALNTKIKQIDARIDSIKTAL